MQSLFFTFFCGENMRFHTKYARFGSEICSCGWQICPNLMVEEPILTQVESAQLSVNVIVGGVYYSLSVADVARFPDSYFAHLQQSHWTKDSAAVVQINRNGELFRYISSYVFCGLFEPPDRPIVNLETLLSVREEAGFYNLPKLIQNWYSYPCSSKKLVLQPATML